MVMAHLTAGVELIEHCPRLNVPEPDVFVSGSAACRQDAGDVRVPCQSLHRGRMLMKLP